MDGLFNVTIPRTAGIQAAIDALRAKTGLILDAVTAGLEQGIAMAINGLLWWPPTVLAVMLALLAFMLRRCWVLGFLIPLALLLIIQLGYWAETIETLVLVAIASSSCMILGVPLGIAVAHRPNLHRKLHPLSRCLRAIPLIVYLLPTALLFGLGQAPGLIAAIMVALPAAARRTCEGVVSAPRQLLDASEAFGATMAQRFWKFELPYALPHIRAAWHGAVMLSLGMVVLAALAGIGGLGQPLIEALTSGDVAKSAEVGLSLALIAILLDRLIAARAPDRGGA